MDQDGSSQTSSGQLGHGQSENTQSEALDGLFADLIDPTMYVEASNEALEPEPPDYTLLDQIVAPNIDLTSTSQATSAPSAIEESSELTIPSEAGEIIVRPVPRISAYDEFCYRVTFYKSGRPRTICGVWAPTRRDILAEKLGFRVGAIGRWSRDREDSARTHLLSKRYTAYSPSGNTFPFATKQAAEEANGFHAVSRACSKGATSIKRKATGTEPELTTFLAYHCTHSTPPLAKVKGNLPNPDTPIHPRMARPGWVSSLTTSERFAGSG